LNVSPCHRPSDVDIGANLNVSKTVVLIESSLIRVVPG